MSTLNYKNKDNETKQLSQVTIATITKEQIIDTVYPVGSIYTSINPLNPSVVWGIGTWEEWGSGRVPIGVKVGDSNFNEVEKEGGSYTVSLSESQLPSHSHSYDKVNSSSESHILTTSQIPKHTHKFDDNGQAVTVYGDNQFAKPTADGFAQHADPAWWCGANKACSRISNTGGGQGHSHNINTTSSDSGSIGSGNPHNNIQPYITCYMWKRVK